MSSVVRLFMAALLESEDLPQRGCKPHRNAGLRQLSGRFDVISATALRRRPV
jgi:hypothetical protein